MRIELNKHSRTPLEALEGTTRLETFSDAVIAIVMTILILEIHVPEIETLTNIGALEALIPILPKLLSFLVSFVTIAIFWVNHHHFFHPIHKSDGALLWYNNHLLFWLTVIPFATAFIGDYPQIPLVVALYGFVLFMGALAFALMGHHVFFKSHLLPDSIPLSERRIQFRRTLVGVGCYGVATGTAFLNPTLALVIFIVIPVYFFIPQRVGLKENHTKE
jgi:uncharacterized membrane protein